MHTIVLTRQGKKRHKAQDKTQGTTLTLAPTLPCLVLSYLVLSYLALSCLVCLVLSYLLVLSSFHLYFLPYAVCCCLVLSLCDLVIHLTACDF
jgi:hypothetical protein